MRIDTTYRFNDTIGNVANTFIQQNPVQLSKPLNSLVKGNKSLLYCYLTINLKIY